MKNGTAVDAETYPHFILRLKLLEEIQDTFGGESVKQCRTYSKPFRPNTETPKKVQQFSKKKMFQNHAQIYHIYPKMIQNLIQPLAQKRVVFACQNGGGP